MSIGVKTVVKRNGTVVPFDRNKIVRAVSRANDSIQPKFRICNESIHAIADTVAYSGDQQKTVEEIQDEVESLLVKDGNYELSKAYIIYRYQRSLDRKGNSTDGDILRLLRNNNKEMNEENSNKNTTVASTQRDYIAGIVSRDLTRRVLLPPHISKAHDDGVLHFHE